MRLPPWKKWLARPEAANEAGWRRRLLGLLRFLFLAAREFHLNLCLERAATLAFATILSLIPLSILFFSFVALIEAGPEIKAYAKERIFPLVAPDFQAQMGKWLDEDIAGKFQFKEGFEGIVGLAAFISLVVAALGVAVTAERNVNRIWKTRSTRGYLQKFSAFWLILTISPFVLIASGWVEGWLVPAGSWMEQVTRDYILVNAIYRFCLPAVFGLFAFTLLYVLLPSARVHLRSAALGGLVAALLWEASKRGFTLYMRRTTSLYGQLAIVPLFLVWIYVNWLIILWGCVLSYVHQHYASLFRHWRENQVEPASDLPLAFIGMYLLEKVGRQFAAGAAPPGVEAVADDLGIAVEAVEEAGRFLVAGGILAETAEPARAYVLTRPPEAVPLRRVAELLPCDGFPEDLLAESATGPAAANNGVAQASSVRAALRAKLAYLASFEPETLAHLLAPREAAPAPPEPRRDATGDGPRGAGSV